MAAAINPADKNLIAVIELLLWMQLRRLTSLAVNLFRKSNDALAASNVCRFYQSIK
jgi:hypothetical protein